MQIPLVIRGEKMYAIPEFKTYDKTRDDSYCLLSNYFIRNNSIRIRTKSTVFTLLKLDVSNKEDVVDTNGWLNGNGIFHEISPSIIGNNIPSVNILIQGQSGVGKSLFCRNLCQMLSTDQKYQYFSTVIDCRDLIGKQPDSVRQKVMNVLLESIWRSPSIICLENLDLLIPNCVGNESNLIQIVHIDCVAAIIKCFFENINKLGVNSKIISISTCRSSSALHKNIIRRSGKSSILFGKIIDVSEIDKNVFMTVVENCLDELETNRIVDGDSRNRILSRLQLNFGDSDDLCGFDALSISKNTIMQAIQRTDRDSRIEIDSVDLDKSISISSSYIFSNLNKKQRPAEIYFRDLYGFDDIKNKLNEIFVWPSLYPDLFRKSPIKLQHGVLLYGLPGCGKSHLALALSNEVKMNFRMIKGPELLSKYIGASEEQVRLLFEESRRNQPILLFFDEFDSLAPKRGHDNTGVTDRVVNQLLTEIDGVSGSNNSGIFILAASNRPDLIDTAILRPGRISGRILCKPPTTVQERIASIIFFLRKSKIPISDEAFSIWSYLDSKLGDTQWLDSYSYADLVSVVKQTENNSVFRFHKSDQSPQCEMSLTDLQASINSSRPSLTHDQISCYLKAYDDFTNIKLKNFPLKSKATLA